MNEMTSEIHYLSQLFWFDFQKYAVLPDVRDEIFPKKFLKHKRHTYI